MPSYGKSRCYGIFYNYANSQKINSTDGEGNLPNGMGFV